MLLGALAVLNIRAAEVYTHFDPETGVLMYYYDDLRTSRGGTNELYNPDIERFKDYFRLVTKAVIHSSMKNAPLTSTRNMFYGGKSYSEFYNMTTIEGLENLNTANVTDMSQMFMSCTALTSLDLSSFNIAKVTDMSYMFGFCKALKTIYCDYDWSTNTVLTNSSDMFYGCHVLVGGKGTSYNTMPDTTQKLDKTYARPDGGTSSPGYFTSSSDKPVVFTQYGSNTLTYYYGNMAAHSGYNKELYDPTSSEKRFVSYSENIRKVVIDESMKDALLTSTVGMFWGGTDQELINLTSIEGLENLNTANVTNMNSMFNRCKRLETLDLSTFDVSKVEYASYMFRGCESLTTIYCDNDWSASTVMTQSYGMFQDCTSLVGGKGTVFDSSVHYSLQDKRYARPDGGTSKPGYFTSTTSSGILPTVNDNLNVNDSYYTLDGRKLQGKPTQTGVYIRNGRKVLIK